MIVGLFVKNIKTYSGINFIPLTYNDKFCGLIGMNGIGKSSVLEALDCFFNDREWNYNISYKKHGLNRATPYIVPIFLIKKREQEYSEDLIDYSSIAWSVAENDINNANREHITKFITFRESLKYNFSPDEYFLLPIGIDYLRNPNISIFESYENIDSFDLNKILKEITSRFDYIYIPKDIEPEKMMRLETEELQTVIGKSLQDIVAEIFRPNQIASLNRKLLDFTLNLSGKLGEYEFKIPSDRQDAIRKNNFYTLIINDFFTKRKLHKRFHENRTIDITLLSSGEKQQAILDLYYNLIESLRESDKDLIVAIDEPEASLHVSLCFGQFEKLYKLRKKCEQIIFTSHWYGFIPTMQSGALLNISKNNEAHQFDLFDIYRYREQIKKQIQNQRGYLPLDISLKGINDFTQSIISSVLRDEPYNWIICEGTSDKIYLNYYLREEREKRNLRIIPVGGIGELRKIYIQLLAFFEDRAIKREIKGKVLLLGDTDEQRCNCDVKNNDKLFCKRIIRDSERNIITLVDMDSASVAPETSIEDSLNGKALNKILNYMKVDYFDELDFIEDVDKPQICAAASLDLRESERVKFKAFLGIEGMKSRIARNYIQELKENEYNIPEWIEEVKNIFN